LLRIANFEDSALAIKRHPLADHLFLEVVRAEDAEFVFLGDLRQSPTDRIERHVARANNQEIGFHKYSGPGADKPERWTVTRLPVARNLANNL
jgi:hypothetical protein